MSDINVKLKQNLEDANTLFKILFATIKIGEPASKRKIADVADISSQLVDYHIDKLVANGQLIIVDSKYMAQKAFLDRSIYKFLKEKVITQALVDNIAYKLDFSQAEVQDNAVLEESIITLLKLFTIELKEK
ncbi:MAG: helix-turn-helix domain-containing protein [Candidatus Poseidoniia archaeon]|jgi:biotin operon repressor|nr:helix-turn-helix domain-containing protein [Candidatus Poseidoniia archaeon]|tara:strand:+ start:98 stop:493 length:396 start_codon:yes stop_codon:yes gene_type:complete